MRALKAELNAVVAALEQSSESVEETAEAAIQALDQARAERTTYGVAIQGTPMAFIYQPFGNRQEALAWVKRYGLAGIDGLSVGVVPLFNKDRVPKRHAEAWDELMKKRAAAEEPPRQARGRRRKT